MPTYMQCIAHAIDNRAALLVMACAEVYMYIPYVEGWSYMCRTGGIWCFTIKENCL